MRLLQKQFLLFTEQESHFAAAPFYMYGAVWRSAVLQPASYAAGKVKNFSVRFDKFKGEDHGKKTGDTGSGRII